MAMPPKGAEELGRPKFDVVGERLLSTGTDETIEDEEVPASGMLRS
jgi:hypothetical protein